MGKAKTGRVRPFYVGITLSPEEEKALEILRGELDVSRSTYMRRLLRTEMKRLQEEKERKIK